METKESLITEATKKMKRLTREEMLVVFANIAVLEASHNKEVRKDAKNKS